MSNIYLEYYEESVERYGIDGISSPDTGIVILALVKELQTLNESVKLLILEVKGINLGLPFD